MSVKKLKAVLAMDWVWNLATIVLCMVALGLYVVDRVGGFYRGQ